MINGLNSESFVQNQSINCFSNLPNGICYHFFHSEKNFYPIGSALISKLEGVWNMDTNDTGRLDKAYSKRVTLIPNDRQQLSYGQILPKPYYP